MLATLLPLLESLGAESGAATSLGRQGGIGSTLSRLLGGSEVRPFGDQNELDGAMRQISDLTSRISAARSSIEQMRSAHAEHEVQQQESERLYGFRDPQRSDQMAALQRQQIEHARQMQLQQQQMENLQARAAVSMDPQLAAQEQRRATFGRAGAIELGGQLGIQAARSVGSWAYQPIGEAASFLGGTAGNIANQAVGQAGNALSNIASTATHGASLGMAVGGPVGAAVGGVAGGMAQASVEIAKLPSRIVEWSQSLTDSQREISRFSGVMSGAYAQSDVRKLRRDITSAHETGGPTAELVGSLDNLYDTIAPLKDNLTNVIAVDLAAAVKVLNAMAPLMAEGLVAAGSLLIAMNTFNGIGAQLVVAGTNAAKAMSKPKPNINNEFADDLKRMLGRDPLKPPSIPRR